MVCASAVKYCFAKRFALCKRDPLLFSSGPKRTFLLGTAGDRLLSELMHSFSYQDPTIWKQLPVSVRHSTSVTSFKSSLKTFLLKIIILLSH